MASCTMSSACSSSRTANSACLNARRSTPARNSESSLREARSASLLYGREGGCGRGGDVISKHRRGAVEQTGKNLTNQMLAFTLQNFPLVKHKDQEWN